MSIKSFIKNKNNNIDDVLQNNYLTGNLTIKSIINSMRFHYIHIYYQK